MLRDETEAMVAAGSLFSIVGFELRKENVWAGASLYRNVTNDFISIS